MTLKCNGRFIRKKQPIDHFFLHQSTPQGPAPAMTWGMFLIGWLELGNEDKAETLLARSIQNAQSPFLVSIVYYSMVRILFCCSSFSSSLYFSQCRFIFIYVISSVLTKIKLRPLSLPLLNIADLLD